MGSPLQHDMGGLDLIVNTVRTGATGPNQTGTELTVTDLGTLTGVTPGAVTASKALVVDSSKDLATLGTVTAATFVGALNASSGTVRVPQAVDNVHDTTPTAASIVTALGAAARGKIGTIDDADGEVNGYLCFATDNSWFFVKLTKAT